MGNYYGLIQIENIENVFPIEPSEPNEAANLNESHVRFVHYPDCQQLIIWLPENYCFYDGIEIIDVQSEQICYSEKVSDIVSGSVQIIIDTLFLTSGKYKIKISKKDGCNHIIYLFKYAEGQLPEVTVSAPIKSVDLDSPPILYRDGFGNILPNEDLDLREQIINQTMNKITRRLEYVSYGRDGEVIYIEGEKRITFLMEMGGNDCVFYINIPARKDWEATTKFLLKERDDIIRFVAEGTQRDQASSCYFKITETEIAYYRKNGN